MPFSYFLKNSSTLLLSGKGGGVNGTMVPGLVQCMQKMLSMREINARNIFAFDFCNDL